MATPLKYFIQWKGNTPEPVVIDLHKNGVFLKTIGNNANTGAYPCEKTGDIVVISLGAATVTATPCPGTALNRMRIQYSDYKG